jgi:hypothetical protein
VAGSTTHKKRVGAHLLSLPNIEKQFFLLLMVSNADRRVDEIRKIGNLQEEVARKIDNLMD